MRLAEPPPSRHAAHPLTIPLTVPLAQGLLRGAARNSSRMAATAAPTIPRGRRSREARRYQRTPRPQVSGRPSPTLAAARSARQRRPSRSSIRYSRRSPSRTLTPRPHWATVEALPALAAAAISGWVMPEWARNSRRRCPSSSQWLRKRRTFGRASPRRPLSSGSGTVMTSSRLRWCGTTVFAATGQGCSAAASVKFAGNGSAATGAAPVRSPPTGDTPGRGRLVVLHSPSHGRGRAARPLRRRAAGRSRCRARPRRPAASARPARPGAVRSAQRPARQPRPRSARSQRAR